MGVDMDAANRAADQLEALSQELRQRGNTEVVARLEQIVGDLRRDLQAPTSDVLLTTGQAAAQLGVRSVNTIKRWAREGLLQGCHRGGRVLISKASVDKLRESSVPVRQRQFEQELSEVLEAFDAGDEQLPPTKATQAGRKPWERVGSAAT